MNAKYYTPEIEEFHVGFEYEVYDDTHDDFTYDSPVFKKAICDKYLEIPHIILDQIRVRRLDQGDIEDLGWDHDSTVKGISYFYLGSQFDDFNFFLSYNMKSLELEIFDSKENRPESFYGTIKNKSELKRLMNQFGINK